MMNLDGEEIVPEVEETYTVSKANPFEYVKAINHTKENLVATEDGERQYNPFIVNRALSQHLDTLFFANEMNSYPMLDKHMQFTFLINSVRPRKRYGTWAKSVKVENLDVIKKWYKYSTEKALQVLPLLTDKQILAIKKRLRTGGLNNGESPA